MTKNNQLVNRRRFSNSLRNELADQFDTLHKETQIPKSKLLDQAIELLLQQYKMDTNENKVK